jgi:hypothetical protein
MTNVVSAEVSAGDLSSALDGFAAAVGAEHVLTDEAALREFRDPFATRRGTTTRPRRL